LKNKIIGVIGGSGLYEMKELANVKKVSVSTPFGRPSDKLVKGEYRGTTIYFLPRHGVGHRILPSEINFRANIYAMKSVGVQRIISVSAVGSMREDIKPGHVVVPDQFFDRTKGRASTFFGEGIVGHIMFADPTCAYSSEIIADAAKEEGATVHEGGCYICIEGPQFSTRAESRIYRQWGVDVIGMTNIPEAKLAREAEICYATMALATDYDCWYEPEEDVSVDAVVAVLKKNAALAKRVILRAVDKFKEERDCSCESALKNSIITDPKKINRARMKKLKAIMGRYS